ncbi:MAG TPA: branched-chain-amino-acid transaminase [Methanocorpusculum sp.]|nr:branched-chain-amino-acid transaminase [Methanocorpusculum sp.]HJJ39929.1 branched-chain-amino-acid transaminase [Methanocorpusculum sp.]HJJ49118.1 branched-chain-amino-acid transaminase [Methanocorpusculum sp.]HJJ56776.1 branched-chain-amino-acid transaminase [Methanocorpusculum sp.]HJJ95084.1 branched-chain-amino-acid transaminase [Methanocorpusculum sp.]
MLVYVDGEFVAEEDAKVSIFDHGFLYGDGVFEGIRAYNGRVFRLKEHIDRMFDSAKAIDLNPGITKEQMSEIIKETLRKNNLKDAYIRPIISRGKGPMGLDPTKCPKPTIVCAASPTGGMYGDLYDTGITAVTVCVRRNTPDTLPPNVKSLNYLNNILGKIEANYKGGDEAIFLDRTGKLAEGSGDNIYLVKDGVIFTPPTINNLKGITRLVILELAEKLGIKVEICELGLFDLYTADEVIVSGTMAELCPIVKIDGRVIGTGKPGEVCKKILKEFQKETANTGDAY